MEKFIGNSFPNSNNFVPPWLSIYVYLQLTAICYCWNEPKMDTEECKKAKVWREKKKKQTNEEKEIETVQQRQNQ